MLANESEHPEKVPENTETNKTQSTHRVRKFPLRDWNRTVIPGHERGEDPTHSDPKIKRHYPLLTTNSKVETFIWPHHEGPTFRCLRSSGDPGHGPLRIR